MTKVNFYQRFILYFIFFGIIISIVSSVINYFYHHNLQEDILKKQAQEIYTINIQNNLQPTLHNLENTLLNLSHEELLKKYITTKDERIKQKLQLMFLATANANNNLMQVRYISKKGHEVIRIDRDTTTQKTYIIPDNKLQDKSNRYYFIESSQLQNNRIWYSQLDLNIENGKIEVPYKPTLRIATPLFIHTKFEGIIILNLQASELLQSISSSNVFDHYILDNENNYIIHPNDTYSFNKYTSIQRDISNDFPNGINDPFIFQYPLKNILHNKDHALFILKPKEQYIKKHTLAGIEIGIYTLIINILLSTFIAFILAKRPTQLQANLLEVNKKLSKTNQHLQEEKLFRESILNNSAHAIIATDINGTITLFNKQAQKLLGYTEEELIGKETPAIFHKESEMAQRAKEYEKELGKKIDPIFKVFTIKSDLGLDNDNEWIYISKYGLEFYVSLHMTALKDIDGNIQGYMGIAEDITHKKYLSKQLEEQRVELETIVNTTKDGIAILDLATNFLYFNDSYLQMTGFTQEELFEKSCAALSAPEDVEKAKKVVQEVIEKGYVDNFEKTCIVNNGERVNINMSLALMPDQQRILIATKDITQNKRKERQLRNYMKLVDQNIITSSTNLKGHITYVSEAFCKISGYSKEELINKSHSIVKHPDMNETIYQNLWKALNNDEVWVGEIKNKKKDGGYYWVKATISPTFDETGKKNGYTAIRQDITDKKIIEEISITDGLTNIYNRRHFNELFPKIINSAKRDNELVSFLIMDIDHFKQYNDTYGHQMGDEVLIQVARAIKNSLHRADDHCFRLGGEEFGVIFKADTKEKAEQFANTIRQNIENLHIEHSKNSASPYITASMGLICKNANEIGSDEEVYKQGDELLYIAKESGRNRVAF